jgi:hypothetical protein
VFLPIFTILAADLYILPSNKDLNVGDNLNIAVYVDSIDQAMNAVSFRISYPEDLLKFVSLSKTGTIINLWVQEPRGGNGEVSAEGIVLNPGFTGSKGKILNITFKALNSGKADLSFISGTVLANDGLGTNILKNMRGGSYSINELSEIIEKPSISYLPTPKITSPTHPDQEKWYNNNNPIFEWELPDGVIEVKLVYSKKPDTIPVVSYIPPISKKELNNIADGTYYFRAQFISETTKSEIATYKFNIDTQNPVLEEFSLGLEDSNIVKFKIKAKDETSGIDKIEIYLDNNLVLTLTSITSTNVFEDVIKNIEVGRHIFKAVIYDKAGNSIQKEEIINIPQPTVRTEIVVQKDYNLYFILLFVSILLIIVILIIYITKHRIEIIHKEIKKEKIENIKSDLRKHLKETLQDLRHDISLLDEDPKLSQKERELYKEAKNILEEAEKKIEEKLKELE